MKAYAYSIDTPFPDNRQKEWRNVIKAAFAAWEKSGKVTFYEVSKGTGDIRVVFADLGVRVGAEGRYDGLPTVGLNTRKTYSLVTRGGFLGAIMRLFSPAGDYDALSIIQHEIGHILLGDDHISSPNSIRQDDYFNLPSKPSAADFARLP